MGQFVTVVTMKICLVLIATTSLVLCAPQASFSTKTGGPGPSAAAALAYTNRLGATDLCSVSSQAFLRSIFAGRSAAEATASAETAYRNSYNAGARVDPNTPCAAAEKKFRGNYETNKDAVLDAAVAFLESWPGLSQGNPCAVAGKAYVTEIISGRTVEGSGARASKAFIAAFSSLAKSGNSMSDPACAAAAEAFIASSDSFIIPSAGNAAKAFLSQTLGGTSSPYDPACAAASNAYIDAFASGTRPEVAGLIAALAYVAALDANPTSGSSCASAAEAYSGSSPIPSKSTAAAMVAYIKTAVATGEGVDPVCGAANLAFLDAKISGKTDA